MLRATGEDRLITPLFTAQGGSDLSPLYTTPGSDRSLLALDRDSMGA